VNIRCAILTLWTSLAVALSAAVCGDAATEWLSNQGFWGSSVHDLHQESLLPTALLAGFVTISLAFYVLALHLRTNDPLLRFRRSASARLCFATLCVLLTFAVVVLMEGYEVRFGGVGAFDPGSVIVTHALPVLYAYALIGILIDRMLGVCLRVACGAARAVAAALVEFMRRDASEAVCVHAGLTRITPVEQRPERIRPACGLRAPPTCEWLSLVFVVRRFSWSSSGGS
jgi:hypothetical protein